MPLSGRGGARAILEPQVKDTAAAVRSSGRLRLRTAAVFIVRGPDPIPLIGDVQHEIRGGRQRVEYSGGLRRKQQSRQRLGAERVGRVVAFADRPVRQSRDELPITLRRKQEGAPAGALELRNASKGGVAIGLGVRTIVQVEIERVGGLGVPTRKASSTRVNFGNSAGERRWSVRYFRTAARSHSCTIGTSARKSYRMPNPRHSGHPRSGPRHAVIARGKESGDRAGAAAIRMI